VRERQPADVRIGRRGGRVGAVDRPDLSRIRAAAERLRPLIHRTPIVTSRLLDEAAGRHVFLKAECLQRGGSFKIRGAATALQAIGPDARRAGVVAHSSGNHAQAVALAARHFGIDALIVMPEDANRLKVAATTAYGATVVQAGVTTANRAERADEYVREGRYLIHPFDDWSVITGQGTLGLEIAEDAPGDVEMVFFPIGGGGLISGSTIALRALRPKVRIVGVEPAACAAAKASREAGRRVNLPPAQTVADGARVSVGEKAWSVISGLVDDIVSVDDEEILRAVHFILTRSKLVVEPTGAMTVAALLSRRFRAGAAVAVLSGGNLDPEVLMQPWSEKPT
jgi:threonine dehydratase